MSLLAAVLLAAGAARPTAALVVLSPAPGDEAEVRRARAALEERFELLADPELRQTLEADDDPFHRAQESLARARQALRRFEMDAARRALAEARERAALLAPTAEARALVVEVAVREAELERVESRPAEVTRHLGEALSIDPSLSLDRDLYAPPLIAQLAAARERKAQAPKLSVRVDTVPPGARVLVEGAERCCTPLTVEVPAGWQVFWFHRDQYRPATLPLLLSSPGPVSAPLTPESRAERVRPLVAAVRAAAGADRATAAAALREALGVEAVALLEQSGEAPSIYERAAEPAAAAVTAPGPEPIVEGPGLFARRWPVFVAAAAGALLAAGGGAMGAWAQSDARAADAMHFASDGSAQYRGASGKAAVANGLYAGAALCAVTGIVLYFVF